MLTQDACFGAYFIRGVASIFASGIWDFLLYAAMIDCIVQTFHVRPNGRITYSQFIEVRLGPVTGFGQ